MYFDIYLCTASRNFFPRQVCRKRSLSKLIILQTGQKFIVSATQKLVFFENGSRVNFDMAISIESSNHQLETASYRTLSVHCATAVVHDVDRSASDRSPQLDKLDLTATSQRYFVCTLVRHVTTQKMQKYGGVPPPRRHGIKRCTSAQLPRLGGGGSEVNSYY